MQGSRLFLPLIVSSFLFASVPCIPVPTRAGPAILPKGGGARGVVNLGGGPAATEKDPAYERFQQVDVQWADIQPEEAVFNWTVVREAVRQFTAAGRMVVLKINSNVKPNWLYRKVPFANITWMPEQFDGKTAMYWHPAYIKALSTRIEKTAEFLANDATGKQVVYFRQTWAAIGEEGFGIPDDEGAAVTRLRDGNNWIVPKECLPSSSCNPPPSYIPRAHGSASPTDSEYKASMAAVWMASFGHTLDVTPQHQTITERPAAVLLLRADEGEEDGVFYSKYYNRVLSGGFGWFHTAAAMEETQCFNQTFRYAPFRRDCLTDKVVGFAEACGLQHFVGGKAKTPELRAANFTNMQGAYWELLSNMANGMHVSGVHSAAYLYMNDPTYNNFYSWADQYMGLHASPEIAPGAWVALRSYGDNHPPSGDYGFLMQHAASEGYDEDAAAPQIQQCGGGKDKYPYGAWCRQLLANASIYFTVDRGLVFSNGAGFRVVYLDDSNSLNLQLRYDDGSTHGAIGMTIKGGGSGEWQEATNDVEHAVMKGGGPHGAAIWMTNQGNSAARLHLIEVTKTRQPQVYV